uniref:AI-2E family transporter n=1 Tax=Caldimicrobium thiodismutans TaxID=1653476 RepID=A0A832GMZ3_9BACT
MTSKGFSLNIFIILLLSFIILGAFVYILFPFFMVIFWGGLLAFFLNPLYIKIKNLCKGRARLSALITLFIFILFILIPLIYLGFQFYLQVESLASQINEATLVKFLAYLDALKNKFIFSKIYPHLEIYIEQFQKQLPEHISNLTQKFFQLFSSFIAQSFSFILKLVFTLFTLYYFLVDGERAIRIIKDLIPAAEEKKDIILQKMTLIVQGVLYGNLLTALIQGGLSLFIYYVLGISPFVLLAFLTVLASFLPFLGTGLVWIPLTIFLFLSGHYIKALILLLFCALTIAQVDNLLKPLLIGGKTKIHNLLMFFAVLGGISQFGLSGIFLGPIILGLFLSILEIYKSHLLEPLNYKTSANNNHA